jgi:hypothetical protein
MDYYNGPTMDTDDSLAANPEDEANSKIEQVPGKQEDNGKPGNEERRSSTKLTSTTQLTHMEEGSEPVNEIASTKEETEGSSSVEPE